VASRIEDYALLGDMHAAALVARDGSIDWFCAPRFDSPAAFAALVGTPDNGRWQIAPEAAYHVERRYRPESLVLETTFVTAEGSVTLVDAMLSVGGPRILRSVRGNGGVVAMRMEYVVRFDYGAIVPWVRRVDEGLLAIGGPDALLLNGDAEMRAEGMKTVATFSVGPGERVDFELTYFKSHEPTPVPRTPGDAFAKTDEAWDRWLEGTTYEGPYRDAVMRSLVTLKALTYLPTGGIVAAVTTSLPERIGGVRNWDYRYCWLRDATFTLYALLAAGHTRGAFEWRSWLLRAIAGRPGDLQIAYGVTGNRRLPEMELEWLAGYEGSRPVRIGNGAHGQFQLDVYGEVIDLLHTAHRFGLETSDEEWALSREIVLHVEEAWRVPDRGLWEIRGEPRHFTHSKVMAWVALDRGIKAIETSGLDGPLERWRFVRDEIFAEVLANAYDPKRGTFTQSYGSSELDAATLLIPAVGFLPSDDARVVGTVDAIQRELMSDGFLLRYTQSAANNVDGLPPGEGAFLACSFWLVDAFVMVGRVAAARELFERLLALANDVGLLAEEYEPGERRLVGNFPQAFSHVGLINSAFNLSHDVRPVADRAEGAA